MIKLSKIICYFNFKFPEDIYIELKIHLSKKI